MKPLNRFIVACSFKMAILKMVAYSLWPGDFMVSLDLSHTYFHVLIHHAHWHFLQFHFGHCIFQFKEMPFGLASAPQVFTKLTCPVTLFCHHLGIRIIFYLDDSLIMARSRQVLFQHWELALSLRKRLGFLVSLQESDLHPSQQFMFLGLCWDTETGAVSLPHDKRVKLQSSASRLLIRTNVTCLQLQKFLGLTNFACFTVPRAHLLQTRHCRLF